MFETVARLHFERDKMGYKLHAPHCWENGKHTEMKNGTFYWLDLLRGSSPRKSAKSAIFSFLQKKCLYMWVDHVPKYYEASSTINLINGFFILYIYNCILYLCLYILYIFIIYIYYIYFFLSIRSDHKTNLCKFIVHE